MRTLDSEQDAAQSNARGVINTWTCVMAVVLGLLLAAEHGSVASTQYTVKQQSTEQWAKAWKCPPDELEEENVTLAECHAMAARVAVIITARPAWFRQTQIALGSLGVLLALASAVAAISLLGGSPAALRAFVAIFGALAILDVVQVFVAASAGAILKADYLWRHVTWLAIHSGFLIAGLGVLMSGRSRSIGHEPQLSGVYGHAPGAFGGHTRTAAILHAIVAASVFFLLIGAWWLMALPWGAARGFPTQLHKNIGVTVVALMAVLLLFRLRHRARDRAPTDQPKWMRRLAAADHVLIYVVVFIAGVSGYLSSAFSGWSTTLWWLVPLPNWAGENDELNAFFSDIHVASAWVLLALVAAHIAGALFHAARRDSVITRMLHW